MNGEDEEEEEKEKKENEEEKKCTVTKTRLHHAVTVQKKLVTMWKHMACRTCYCLMIAALGKQRKDDLKAELCIVVRSIINIQSQDLRHRSTLL